ncbi:hypothetical protein K6L59_03695 [Candidatus Phytoplasma sp. Tabriz.2]|nr:hypothetical protein [Candidatus Phytoplasma australiense]
MINKRMEQKIYILAKYIYIYIYIYISNTKHYLKNNKNTTHLFKFIFL